jgi:hypothetical protein
MEGQLSKGLREALLSRHPMERFVWRVRAEVRRFVVLAEEQLPKGLRGASLSKRPAEGFMRKAPVRGRIVTGITFTVPDGTMPSREPETAAR